MVSGISYADAITRYRSSTTPPLRASDLSVEDMLLRYHPDRRSDAHAVLAVGANRGDKCQPELTRQLQSNALIDDVDIAGAPLVSTDVLIVGGGGAGCAAALVAAGRAPRSSLPPSYGSATAIR